MGDYEKKSNICVIRVPKGEEKEGEAEYILKRIVAEKLKLRERHKPTDSRIRTNSKQKNPKVIHTKTHAK